MHALDITAAVGDGGRFHTDFAYPIGLFEDQSVEELGRLWQGALHDLARLTGGGLTPSDVALAVDQDRIERWERELGRLDDIWPLSPLQAGLLFYAGLTAGAVDLYSGQVVLRLTGTVDADRMRRAAHRLLDRHDALRSAFGYDDDGVPAGWVLGDVDAPWREVRTRDAEAVVARSARCRSICPRAPAAVRARPSRRRGHTGDHQPSHPVRRLVAAVGGAGPTAALHRRHGAACPGAQLPRLPGLACEQDRDAAIERWRAALTEVDGATLLVPDAGPLRELPREVSVPVPDRLGHAARGVGVTVNTVVQAAWAVLLGRLLGRADVVFGATVSGRPADLTTAAETVGLFINTVPVRAVVTPALRVRELLNALQQAQSEMLEAHHVGLSEIVSAVGDAASFDTLTVFESYPSTAAGSMWTRTSPGCGCATSMSPTPRTIRSRSSRRSNPNCGSRSSTRPSASTPPPRTGSRRVWVRSSSAFATDTNARLARIDLLDAAERVRILHDWNNTRHPAAPATLVDLLDAWADSDAPAVTYAEQALSFAEFTTRAEALARRLAGVGVGPESIVGVALRRGVEYLVAIHAVVRAGAAYLPIDPDHPVERTRYVLDNAAPTVVLATRGRRPARRYPGAARLAVDR